MTDREKLLSTIPGYKEFTEDPNIIHITRCNPAQALSCLRAGKPEEITCPDCQKPLSRERNNFFCATCDKK